MYWDFKNNLTISRTGKIVLHMTADVGILFFRSPAARRPVCWPTSSESWSRRRRSWSRGSRTGNTTRPDSRSLTMKLLGSVTDQILQCYSYLRLVKRNEWNRFFVLTYFCEDVPHETFTSITPLWGFKTVHSPLSRLKLWYPNIRVDSFLVVRACH